MIKDHKGEDLVSIDGWTGGLNNVNRPESIGSDELAVASNVDLNKEGKPSRRKGRTKVYTGTNVHSLWSYHGFTFFVEDGDLMMLNPDYTATLMRAGVSTPRMSYTPVNNYVFCMNGVTRTVIDLVRLTAVDWSIPRPAVTLTTSGSSAVSQEGMMPTGHYSAVAVNIVDGYISAPFVDTVRAGAPFQTLHISSTGDETYVTPPGFTAPMMCPLTQLNSAVFDMSSFGPVLPPEMLNKVEPPVGYKVAYFNGRIIIAQYDAADDSTILWFTELYQYYVVDAVRGFIQLNGKVADIIPLTQGMYVGTDKETMYFAGDGPEDLQQATVLPYGMLPWSGTTISAQKLQLEGTSGDVAVFTTAKGICVGMDGGQILVPTEGKIAVDENGAVGSTFLREQDGATHLLSSIQSDGDRSKLRFTDVAVAEVRRNGVVIT